MTATRSFEHRGIVEGFYGKPYSHADRSWWVETLGSLGMNRYVVAPKDDPFHREQWRVPYPPDAMKHFERLVELGERNGVRVGSGVSPGLSIEASSSADIEALIRKLRSFHERGSRFLVLALDDVPSGIPAADRPAFASLAAAHCRLAHAAAEAFPDAVLWFVPNDYTGLGATDYLDELGEALDPRIEVAWTGRCTVAPEITAAEAAERAASLRRRLLLWDNVPVNDGPMRRMLHLGPYTGRGRDLADHVSGILLNPMERPRSSFVMIACAAAYLRDPAGYDPERAWHAATGSIGAGAPDAFRTFAAAHRFHPSTPDTRDDELESALRELRGALAAGRNPTDELRTLRAALGLRRTVSERLRADLADRALLDEIEPWVDGHHEESRRMDAAAQALASHFDPGSDRESDSMARTIAYSIFEGSLTLHPTPATVSYGPRRVFYPQLTSHRDEAARFGTDPALFTGLSLPDEVLALADSVLLPGLGVAERSGARTPAQDDE